MEFAEDEGSADGNRDLLGEGLAVGRRGGKGVSDCFGGFYVHAEVMGGPDRTGLRLEGDGFGVGNAEADLGGFAAADLRRGVEHLDGEVVAAQLLDGGLIGSALLLGLFVADPLVVLLVLAMAREKDPAEIKNRDQQEQGEEGEWVLEERFLRRGVLILGEHTNGVLFRAGRRESPWVVLSNINAEA